MTNKLLYLTKMSLNKKIKTKWFLVANIIVLVAIVGLINIDSIIKFFGGDFEDANKILVIDNTSYLYDDFLSNYQVYSDYLNGTTNTEISKYTKTYDEAVNEITDTDNIILIINEDSINYLNATIVADTSIDTITSQIISYILNNLRSNIAYEKYNISEEMLQDINKPVVINQTLLNEEADNSSQMDMIMNVIFPIFILPFFMLTMFLVQMIGAEINEEKTTKSMEIIISNVSSQTHFFSKLIAGNAFVLLQGLLLIIYLFLGVAIRAMFSSGIMLDSNATSLVTEIVDSLKMSGFIDKLGYIIPLTLVLMILTFVAYSLVAAILASMTTNIEDFQQLQTPIIVVSLTGYYLAIMAAMFDGSIFIKILSYLPFISSLLVPSLLALGQIGIVDIIISFLVLGVTIFLLFKYGLRIYKVGILNYSSNNLWKKMFKALKKENN